MENEKTRKEYINRRLKDREEEEEEKENREKEVKNEEEWGRREAGGD